ncbi:MAG: Spy/CpxP family protein refolding chaperone [Candidatus Omnitrophota bacterium]
MQPKTFILVLGGVLSLGIINPVGTAHAISYGNQSQDYISDKFVQKQRRILKNKEALGLNLKQTNKIEALKINLEKEMVLLDAKIEVINIELRSVLSQDTTDSKTVLDLIDQKSELEKTKAKAQAMAYLNLKDVLTPDQWVNLNNIREIYKGPYGEVESSQ